MSLILATAAVVSGLALLVWSANRFIDGAAATARYAGMPSLLIGMVVIGFGTSAPEMVVSAISSVQGNPGLALGNAYGSNITNIALILGLTAAISPIAIHSSVIRKELPILLGVTLLAAFQLWDGNISRLDAWVLLLVFFVLMGWSIWFGLRQRQDSLAKDVEVTLEIHSMPLKSALIWLFLGIVLLVVSSRILVWGAVEIARSFGVSDLIIGLTVVAVGTSLPELASAIAATKKNEHDLVIGNVLGSNLFNTLAVVGIAGVIHPMQVGPEVLQRDCLVMGLVTLALFLMAWGFKKPARINRAEGAVLILTYFCYTGYLVHQVISAAIG
jgi:cation:H+ antiporter